MVPSPEPSDSPQVARQLHHVPSPERSDSPTVLQVARQLPHVSSPERSESPSVLQDARQQWRSRRAATHVPSQTTRSLPRAAPASYSKGLEKAVAGIAEVMDAIADGEGEANGGLGDFSRSAAATLRASQHPKSHGDLSATLRRIKQSCEGLLASLPGPEGEPSGEISVMPTDVAEMEDRVASRVEARIEAVLTQHLSSQMRTIADLLEGRKSAATD